MNPGSIQGGIPHLEHPVRIQLDITELQVKGLSRSRLSRLCWSRLRRNGLGWFHLRIACRRECESRQACDQNHACCA